MIEFVGYVLAGVAIIFAWVLIAVSLGLFCDAVVRTYDRYIEWRFRDED